MLWLDKIARLSFSFYPSVAAHSTKQIRPLDIQECCWDIKQTTKIKAMGLLPVSLKATHIACPRETVACFQPSGAAKLFTSRCSSLKAEHRTLHSSGSAVVFAWFISRVQLDLPWCLRGLLVAFIWICRGVCVVYLVAFIWICRGVGVVY